MKKIRGSKWLTGGLLAAAAALMIFSGVQGSRAALNYVSNNYVAELGVPTEMVVTIVENGQASEKLITSLPASHKDFKEGQLYNEQLCIRNDGSLDEYVRVVVRRYWSYENGEKCQELSPSLIELGLTEDWILDEEASTEEMLVLYWPTILKAGETTATFCDTISLDGSMEWLVTNRETTDGKYTVIETVSSYNGCYFTLEVEADGVQTHNAADAIQSAWGVEVTVADDGSMSLG